MAETNYLQWLADATATAWWHDSGDPDELRQALANGAVGVTTNPVLCAQALEGNRERWDEEIRKVVEHERSAAAKAESLMRIVVVHAAELLEPMHRATDGQQGYVCAQVNPSLAGDRDGMYAMARRYSSWAPNIAVKLPATAAGLDVMERICSEGTAATITVSFSVPQVYLAGRRYQELVSRRSAGGRIGKCFAVIMIGRLDDYLREVFADSREAITEREVQAAGLSVTKRAYRLFQENGFQAVLLVAALRGSHHITELAGGKLVVSVHPTWQRSLLCGAVALEERIEREVPRDVVEKLERHPEFAKAYGVEGLSENELLTFGLTQRTLSQFIESGWKLLEQFRL
jgi:transaldolase